MRMTITLSERERLALTEISQKEMRRPRDQARYILRKELRALGYLDEERRAVQAGQGGQHDNG